MSEKKADGILLSSILYNYYRKGLVCEAKDARMSSGEFAVLQLLEEAPKKQLLIGELTEKLHTTQPAVSQIVKRMEKKGLIRKEIDSADKRNVHVSATKHGAELFRFFYDSSLSFTQRVIERMETGHGGQLLELLEEFMKCAEKEAEKQ